MIFLNCFRVIFSLKYKPSNFRFRLFFIFNKKESQSCQFFTNRWKTLFEFMTSQAWCFFIFQRYYLPCVMYQVVIQKIRSSYFFKDKIITSGLHLFFQLFTEVLININFVYFTENFLMADNVPNVNAWFPSSLFNCFGDLFLILLWSTMWFIDFVYNKPQLSIRDFFHSGGDNFCDNCFFSFLSIFIFF